MPRASVTLDILPTGEMYLVSSVCFPEYQGQFPVEVQQTNDYQEAIGVFKDLINICMAAMPAEGQG